MLRMPSLLEPRHSLLHLWTSLERKTIPANIFINGDWTLFQSRTTSSRKGDLRGARHGKTEAQKEHFIANNARRRCLKKNFEGIHDRFQKDFKFRDSQLRISRTEAICIQMDEVAQKDFTYRLSSEEYERYKKTWSISQHIWTKCTDETPIGLSESLTKMHCESGEERLAPIPFWQYQTWYSSSSSSSTSWWQ